MSKLSNAKIFGGVGAILTLIGGLISEVISLIGVVLIFIAVKYISEETKDNSIFNNYLISFIFRICSIVAAIAIALLIIGGAAFGSILTQKEMNPKEMFGDIAEEILVGVIIGLIVMWIFLIISATYLRKSYDSIAKYTKVDLFKTTGMLYFIGAITVIIIVGLFILLIAIILEIVSYFSLPDELPESAAETIQ